LPRVTISAMLRFEVATSRTSSRMISLPPTRSNSRSCRTRSSLDWKASDVSEISSSRMVPPLA
jgi:hypothetical protein